MASRTLLLLLLLLASPAWTAEVAGVKFDDKVPVQDDLKKALGGG